MRRFLKKPELLLLIGERIELLNGCREAAGLPKLAKEGSVLLSVFTVDVKGLSAGNMGKQRLKLDPRIQPTFISSSYFNDKDNTCCALGAGWRGTRSTTYLCFLC